MAVVWVTNMKKYVGLSTDTKPTSVLIGSTFYSYNTRELFITYDGTNWTRIN